MKPSSNRRKLILGAGAAGSGLLLGSYFSAPARAQSGALDATVINDNLQLFTGAGCNVLVHKAASGELLIVDGGLSQYAGDLLELISTRMQSGRIGTLVNTHWHPEQTGLNRLLGARQVSIFAHENTRQWLSVEIDRPWDDTVFAPQPESARPTDTFYHYGELPHGNGVQYGYLRQAHTDGDMYVYFPEANVLHAGGVVANDSWPLLDWWTGGWIGGLAQGLETLLGVANESTLIVPANGPVMSKAELVEMQAMYGTIYQRIRESFMSANSQQETLDLNPTAEFNDRYGNPAQFVALAHQSLIAHITPDA